MLGLRRAVRAVSMSAAAAGPHATSRLSSSTPVKPTSINSITLVGVVHDIQTGYVYEDPVTQFVLTTTSIDTTNPLQECVVEKDHHTVRCFGDEYSADVKSRLKEGAVVCVSGRLRLNPQLESSCNKHFYFPYVHVSPPNGSIAVVHGDRRRPPPFADGTTPTAAEGTGAAAATEEGNAAEQSGDAPEASSN